MRVSLLVIDDNPVNLKLACEVLELEGHHVVRATDAEQALQLLQSFTPALILTDIGLPGMDGLELVRQLRGDPRLARVPMVAISAFAMAIDRERALEAGCDGYLTKPIDTRRFAAQVGAYLIREAPT
jgi:CheY-like chemotaxis protein